MTKTKRPEGVSGGRLPVDLDEIVDHRTVTRNGTTETIAVTFLDRACEVFRYGGFIHDVAARTGVARETLHEWMRTGATVARDLNAERRTWDDLTEKERRNYRFSIETARAEFEGKQFLLAQAERLSAGGIPQTVTTEKTDPNGAIIERTTRTEYTLPDSAMLRWRLERRWPDDYGRTRHEITGTDGGPVELTTTPALDTFLADLAQIQQPPENQ